MEYLDGNDECPTRRAIGGQRGGVTKAVHTWLWLVTLKENCHTSQYRVVADNMMEALELIRDFWSDKEVIEIIRDKCAVIVGAER